MFSYLPLLSWLRKPTMKPVTALHLVLFCVLAPRSSLYVGSDEVGGSDGGGQEGGGDVDTDGAPTSGSSERYFYGPTLATLSGYVLQTASTIEVNPLADRLQPRDYYRIAQSLVLSDPLIFGVTIAFKEDWPGCQGKTCGSYAPYVHRGIDQGLRNTTNMLSLADTSAWTLEEYERSDSALSAEVASQFAADGGYATTEWYEEAVEGESSWWSVRHASVLGQDTVVTFSTAFRVNGAIAGVISAEFLDKDITCGTLSALVDSDIEIQAGLVANIFEVVAMACDGKTIRAGVTDEIHVESTYHSGVPLGPLVGVPGEEVSHTTNGEGVYSITYTPPSDLGWNGKYRDECFSKINMWVHVAGKPIENGRAFVVSVMPGKISGTYSFAEWPAQGTVWKGQATTAVLHIRDKFSNYRCHAVDTSPDPLKVELRETNPWGQSVATVFDLQDMRNGTYKAAVVAQYNSSNAELHISVKGANGALAASPTVYERPTVTCPAGASGYRDNVPEDDLTCQPCAAGYFSSKINTAFGACSPCPPGSYTPGPGFNQCQECSSSQYQPYAASDACMHCPTGSERRDQGQDWTATAGAPIDDSYRANATNVNGTSFSLVSLRGTAVSVEECVCLDTRFALGPAMECLECPPDALCQGGTVAPDPKNGFWINPWCPMHTYACLNPDHCNGVEIGYTNMSIYWDPGYWDPGKVDPSEYPGSLMSVPDRRSATAQGTPMEWGMCAPGHTGLLCHQCSDGYGKKDTSPHSECRQCASSGEQWGFYALSAVASIVVVTVTVRLDMDIASKGMAIHSQIVKCVVFYCQIMTILSSVRYSTWPGGMHNLVSSVGAANGGAPVTIISLDCLFHSVPAHYRDFFKILYMVIIVPLYTTVGVLGLTAVYTAVRMKKGAGGGAAGQWRAVFWRILAPKAFLTTMYFLWPNCTQSLLKIFACGQYKGTILNTQNYGDWSVCQFTSAFVDGSQEGVGGRALWVVDLDLQCYSGSHLLWALLLGVPGVLLIVLGQPLASFYVLRRNRARLATRRLLLKYGFIYAAFEPEFFWYGIMDSGLKLSLLLVINIWTESTVYQLVGCLFALGFFTVCMGVAKPYTLQTIDIFMTCLLCTVSFSTFVALIFELNQQPGLALVSDTMQWILAVLVVLLHVAAGGLIAYRLVLEFYIHHMEQLRAIFDLDNDGEIAISEVRQVMSTQTRKLLNAGYKRTKSMGKLDKTITQKSASSVHPSPCGNEERVLPEIARHDTFGVHDGRGLDDSVDYEHLVVEDRSQDKEERLSQDVSKASNGSSIPRHDQLATVSTEQPLYEPPARSGAQWISPRDHKLEQEDVSSRIKAPAELSPIAPARHKK